jgi:hypothetical protein
MSVAQRLTRVRTVRRADPFPGTGAKVGRYDRLRDTSFDYAFLLTQLGMTH